VTSSLFITQLLGGTDVTALGASHGWEHVRIWSGIEGYIPTAALSAQPPISADVGDCQYLDVPQPQPDVLPASNGPFSLSAQGTTIAPATLYSSPDAQAVPQGAVGVGAQISISHWAGDASGQPWYQVTSADGASGWVWSGAVQIDQPNPATYQVGGKPVWQPVAGKGMWFTNYLTRRADLPTVMRAAKLAGITHIYAEVAISRWGLYGALSLDRLLPVAHAAGIAVIAWVYPVLDNVTADIRMTERVAHYVTPSGDRPDGIATDVEEVTDSASVYSYGQVLRAALGPQTLLVCAVLHPFTHAGYPYAAVAASWNVIAPMNYWHSSRSRSYHAADVQHFVTTSITTIRAAMATSGHVLPVEELGQSYDMFSADGTESGHAPSGAEITAEMQAAQALGCSGVSWFEWQTTTQPEWTAIDDFRWG
ncbi:MAG: SH3 domain-containing protein, partial [Ktedonobacterales bacterium]